MKALISCNPAIPLGSIGTHREFLHMCKGIHTVLCIIVKNEKYQIGGCGNKLWYNQLRNEMLHRS